MGPQLSVTSAVWFPSFLLPRLYGPTALCALSCMVSQLSVPTVPAGSPSRGGDITVYVPDKHQPRFPPPFFVFFCFVLVSVSVFIALSTVFHSINSPDNSPLSHSVLVVLFLPYWTFQLYISL